MYLGHMTDSESMESSKTAAEAIARHVEQVVTILQRNGVPAEYNEKYAADEDLYRIAMFKVLPCPKNTQHDWSCCPYAHTNEKARRRSLVIQTYYTKVCPDMQNTGDCPRGEACPMTHSMFEYWMHPQRYRTGLCRVGTKCTRPFCFFAHNQDQLRQGADEPIGMQLLQAFLPCRNGVAGTSTTYLISSSSLACTALPPLPGMQALRSTQLGKMAFLPKQQQQFQGRQVMAMPAGGRAHRPFLAGGSSACSNNHNSSPVASSSSSSCSSAPSTIQLQPVHAMSLLGSSSGGMSPASSGSLGPQANVMYQQPPQLLVPPRQPVQQFYVAEDALAMQLQQTQLSDGHSALSISQPPSTLASAPMILMAPHQDQQPPAATGYLQQPGATLGLCGPSVQLVHATPQQLSQLVLQQPQQSTYLQQQQQQQLVVSQHAVVSRYGAGDMHHDMMLNTAGMAAMSWGVPQDSQQLINQQLSFGQGNELVQQGSSCPQQMPLQVVQGGMWAGQHTAVVPSDGIQKSYVATQLQMDNMTASGL